MSNFKSGSGNLDFGDDDENDENDTETAENQPTEEKTPEPPGTEDSTSNSPDGSSSDGGATSEQSVSDQVSVGSSTATSTPAEKYPYFIRRNNVGDERDNRLEVHVRDKVASQEAEFRSVLADHLETNEITKTDAREFALLTAFQHPERVAELMQKEGFSALD